MPGGEALEFVLCFCLIFFTTFFCLLIAVEFVLVFVKTAVFNFEGKSTDFLFIDESVCVSLAVKFGF